MEEALQHKKAPQCIGLQTTGTGNHHTDGSEGDHALTIKLDQPNKDAHIQEGIAEAKSLISARVTE